MIKTALDVEQDVYDVVRPFLAEYIGGDTYKEDCRPLDSQEEDAVISISFGTADQVQEFGLYINIYVPDLPQGKRRVPNKGRMQELSRLDDLIGQAFNKAYPTEYDATLGRSTICFAEPSINQHRVSINLKVERLTFNSL